MTYVIKNSILVKYDLLLCFVNATSVASLGSLFKYTFKDIHGSFSQFD